MKKIFLILMTVCLLANQSFARSRWATALVDAGGAWGGATSGAPYFPPYGAIVGGVLCGAAASLAIAPPGGGQTYPVFNQLAINSSNNFEEIGANHNNLVTKYLESGLDRSNLNTIVTNLFNFAKELKFDTKEFSVDFIVNETNSFLKNDLTTVEGILTLMSTSIPSSTHDEVKASLNKIISTNSIEEFNKVSIEEENKIIAMSDLNETNITAFHSFFSTLRHSANFWGKEN